MVDYNHAKVVADESAVVSVSGTRDGIPVGPKDRVGDTFQIMEFTNGLNEMFFGGQYRWIYERWTPYVGFGVGFAFPHVEVRRAGPASRCTYDYQFDGVDRRGPGRPRISCRSAVFGVRRLQAELLPPTSRS